MSLQEFKSRIPICRKGLALDTCEGDFNNPFLMGRGIQASTSGSRSRPTRVVRDWDLIAEHAANELLLNATHSLPAPPSIAGIHNLLLNVKFRRAPAKWFSQLDLASLRPFSRNRLAVEYILLYCRLLGHTVPRPEFTDLGDAGKVAAWMTKTKRTEGRNVLRTYSSSAVRVARAALESSLDISECMVFTGGEPLTERRRKFIESTRAAAIPRYSAAETGLIGASCPHRESADDMHIYVDRLAVIPMPRTTQRQDLHGNSLMFSSLSANTGKGLLNSDIQTSGISES